ncbi:MAG: L-asparaginase 1 [Deltaproteobacteria bacterium]|nr:L-asparaginase 1 [Deltaproteobacteria bacterium]
MKRKRILIISTGGTIGMRRTSRGFAPEPGFLAEQMATMSELGHPLMPEYSIHEFDPILDSAEMGPRDWNRIVQGLSRNYADHDGFVVIHGTDTMAYTASALAFMLEGLAKPVILTGSQIPLCEVRNDARDNLITSMFLAANHDLPEVCICFGGRILRGCRSVKVDADALDAFASPRFPDLGTAGRNIRLRSDLIRPAPEPGTPLKTIPMLEAMVGAFRLFPGISADFVENILDRPLKGLIIETFGVGNGPSRNERFIQALKKGCDRGTVIVNCSQCLRGRVEPHGYATGSALTRAGVVSGGDMTAEAALTKLILLFSRDLSPDQVKTVLQFDLRGEMTPDTTVTEFGDRLDIPDLLRLKDTHAP